MEIELLVVPDCPNGAVAAELIAAAVRDTGVQVTITRTIITTYNEARLRGFTGSPTILLNGRDPFASSDAPVALACRLYRTRDGLRGAPDLGDLRRVLTSAVSR